ncbi:hypothetical protein KI387_031826, partial [Taxus chinensis]
LNFSKEKSDLGKEQGDGIVGSHTQEEGAFSSAHNHSQPIGIVLTAVNEKQNDDGLDFRKSHGDIPTTYKANQRKSRHMGTPRGAKDVEKSELQGVNGARIPGDIVGRQAHIIRASFDARDNPRLLGIFGTATC